MTNRRRSATTRSVPAQTPEQLLELTQEHIRPLIPLIDRLNEAGAEDELKVISSLRPTGMSLEAPARPPQPGHLFGAAQPPPCCKVRE